LSWLTPGPSGTAYTVLATLVQLWGEGGSFCHLKKLDANIQQYPSNSGSAGRADGRFGPKLQSGSITVHAVAPVWLYKATRYLAHFPRKEQVMKVGGAAIIKDAPNPKLARLFLDFCAEQTGTGTWRPK